MNTAILKHFALIWASDSAARIGCLSRDLSKNHKSYAISLLHIQQIQRETTLIGTKKLPIGRTYKNRLIERLEYKTP